MPRHKNRYTVDDLAKLKIEREATRLAMDKAKLEKGQSPSALCDEAAFKARAMQMSATEMENYMPPLTNAELLKMGERLGPRFKTWASECGELLLLLYDQNREAGITEHKPSLNEWRDAMICHDSLKATLEKRDLPATSRFDWEPALGGKLAHRRKDVLEERDRLRAQQQQLEDQNWVEEEWEEQRLGEQKMEEQSLEEQRLKEDELYRPTMNR